MKRHIAMTFLVGAGIGLAGCQSPSLGGLAIWNRNNATLGSTAPDVGKQKYGGLAQQFGGNQSQTAASALGQSENDGFLLASWKKTTAAVTGTVAAKPKPPTSVGDDSLRLDKMPKKIGAEVYIGYARLLENQGNYADAEEKYREALKVAPNDLAALVGLGRLFDRQGQGQKALEVYQKAAQAHPTNGLVFNDLGLCYRRQKQLDKSLAAFRKAVELQSDNAKYRNNLAAALVDAGRSDEAYHELAALNSPAVAHYNLAYLLNQANQRADATRHLQEAIAIDPALSPAKEMLAQLGIATTPAAAAPSAQPAPHLATPTSDDVSAAYTFGAADSPAYALPPQVETAAAAPSFHIGDDSASPAAETARRTNWGSATLALPATSGNSNSHPLPPTE
jgi:Tfp pilus assembly protein PilF